MTRIFTNRFFQAASAIAVLLTGIVMYNSITHDNDTTDETAATSTEELTEDAVNVSIENTEANEEVTE